MENETQTKKKKTSPKIPGSLILIVIFVLLFLFVNPFYILNEGQVAIVTQFGKVEKTATEAGVHFRIPFLQAVHTYTAKMLRVDGDPQKILTKEKQYIEVNTTSRWRISNIRQFYESLSTYEAAYSRISDIVDSSVRDVITVTGLADVVRTSNIINEGEHVENLESLGSGDVSLEEIDELSAARVEFPKITKGRQLVAEEILKKANTQLASFGIELRDVIFKGIKYSDELQTSVFNRMIKERNQRAQTFRSTGEGKKAELMGKLDREKMTILSKAQADAERIKGEADATATKIYADAYGKDPEFYSFWKSIEIYKTTLPSAEKVFSTDMEYFRYLYKH